MSSQAPEPRRGQTFWTLFDLRRRPPCLVWFLLLAVPTLVAISLLVGPFQALDESSHYYRAVQLSEGRVLPVVSPQGHAAGDYLDVAAHRLGGYFLFLSYNDWWQPFGAAREDERQAWATPLTGRREFVAFSNTVIYFPLAHAVPALAIAVARAAGAAPIAWLYAGRLANAGVAILIFCLAIALFPEGRAFVFVLALLPRTVFGTAALSADALLVPCAALLAALVARLTEGARLTRSQHGLLFAGLLFVCVGKIAYLPLALIPPLTALLTDRRFSGQVMLLAASSLLTALVWLGWLLAIRHDVFAIRNDVPIDVYGQLAHLVRRPAHAASVLVHTLIQSGPGYIDNLVGGQLGSEQARISRPLVAVTWVILALAAVVALRRRVVSAWLSAGVMAILGGTAIAVFLLLYMQFSGLDAPAVDGVQGRYFLPLLPLLVAFLPQLRLPPARARLVGPVIVAWMLVCSAVQVDRMWTRYWATEPAHRQAFADPRNMKVE